MSSDLFCAFHPKRVTVPSLPLVLSTPAMPSFALALWFEVRFACSARVGRGLHEAQAEGRRRDAEDHVVLLEGLGEVGLGQRAAARVLAPLDRVQAVDAAVALEARLAHGPGRR